MKERKEKKISLEIGELQSFDCSTKVFTNHHIQRSNIWPSTFRHFSLFLLVFGQ